MTKARANATAEAAKGDLRVGSGTNATSVLGVGTNGQVLTAASTSTTGVQWAAATDATKIPLSTVTAAGDLIVGSGSSAVSRLGVGTNGQYLTSNGTTPTWTAAPASGSLTQIATGTLSGSSLAISSIPQTYNSLYLQITGMTASVSSSVCYLNINGDTGTNYLGFQIASNNTSVFNATGNAGAVVATGDTTIVSSAFVSLPAYSVASSYKTIQSVWTYKNGFIRYTSTINTNVTAAITDIALPAGSGTYSSGTYTLYGVK
jgi:hypothetical protein